VSAGAECRRYHPHATIIIALSSSHSNVRRRHRHSRGSVALFLRRVSTPARCWARKRPPRSARRRFFQSTEIDPSSSKGYQHMVSITHGRLSRRSDGVNGGSTVVSIAQLTSAEPPRVRWTSESAGVTDRWTQRRALAYSFFDI